MNFRPKVKKIQELSPYSNLAYTLYQMDGRLFVIVDFYGKHKAKYGLS